MACIFGSLFSPLHAFATGENYLESTDEAALKAKYVELSKPLQINPFNRPLTMHSEESSHHLKGDVYAVVDASYTTFNGVFSHPTQWCDALILNLNVKYCRVSNNTAGHFLTLNLGKKYPQPLTDTYQITFKNQGVINTPNYFAAEYLAPSGPLGTADYRILIEAIPLNDERTFLHLTYAYSFGFAARFAMQTYIATLGRSKVGFTILGKQSDGHPLYIQGIRGIVERNTMRFYLAIEAYLATITIPSELRLKKSLIYWYQSSEQYAVQLHEVELNEYVEMKLQEYQRQQAPD